MKTNHNIQKKLVYVIWPVLIIALLVSNFINYFYMNRIHKRELINNYQEVTRSIAVQLEDELSSVVSLSQVISIDENLQSLLRKHSKYEGYMYYRTLREINTALKWYVALRDDLIEDIYVIDSDGVVISQNEFYTDTMESEWFQNFLNRNSHSGFSHIHENRILQQNTISDSASTLSYIGSVFDLNAPRKETGFLGFLVINIDYQTLTMSYDGMEAFDYMVFENSGAALWGTEKEIEGTNIQNLKDSGEYINGRNYFFAERIPLADWLLVSVVPRSAVNVKMIGSIVLTALFTLIVMIISSLVIRRQAQNLVRPLKVLTEGIEKLSLGEFDTRVEVHSDDEFEWIASAFNKMGSDIERSLEMNLQKEKEKQRSEMRFFMAQIKPHFIYNCLNCIIYLARQGKTDNIIEFTRSFISLLQALIKIQPYQKFALSKEKESIEDYRKITSYRYENTPDILWEIEDSCKEMLLPGLILLPVIENSIFHGIIPKGKGGRIVVSARQTEIGICVQVEDDGCGMSPDKLENLRRRLCEGTETEEHIGLLNVNERLKLCYGADCTLKIDSQENVGTKVWFVIKK